jgi:ABC-type dipeptide/oligopeptide/nickel transport system permease component
MTTLQFLSRRVGRLIVTVLLISTIVFFVLRVIPGDPASVVAGVEADAAELESIRERLGTNQPLHLQYLDWLWRMLRFDFGQSFRTGEAVSTLIWERLPVTLTLTLSAFGLSLLLAIPIGVLSAVYRWSAWDYLGMIYAQLGMAIPGFWLGILLLLLFAVQLGLLPLFGADTPLHFVLPAVALAVSRSAVLVRFVRSSMSDELEKEYVFTARAKGLSDRVVRYRHALKNALLPVITIAGIQFGYMLGGTIIIEQVFSLPGLGRLFLSGIYGRDYPLVQAGVVFIAVVFSLTNFVVDLIYTWANPKIRIGRS